MPNTFLSPDQIFQQIDIKKGMTIADLGCGSGFMTVKAARIVGDEGKVLAIDVQRKVISEIRSKIKLYGLRNIEPLWANLEKFGSLKISDHSVDISLLVQVLHQSKIRKNIFKETKRITKKGGQVLIIEWNKAENVFGSPKELIINKEALKKETELAGFKYIKNIKTDDLHYGYLFQNI